MPSEEIIGELIGAEATPDPENCAKNPAHVGVGVPFSVEMGALIGAGAFPSDFAICLKNETHGTLGVPSFSVIVEFRGTGGMAVAIMRLPLRHRVEPQPQSLSPDQRF